MRHRLLSTTRRGSAATWIFLFLAALVSVGASAARAAADPPRPGDPAHWPAWRGPSGTGISADADPPIHWSPEQNVRWTVDLPGLGHSTPAVWGERIFLTLAVEDEETVEPRRSGVPGAHDNLAVSRFFRFVVMAVDRRDGSVLWQTEVHRALPHEGGHVSASLASASPVTDGERVYAFFGSFGLYALGFDGEIHWQKSLGAMQTKHAHGEGSSPALDGDTLVVNWDHEGPSYLAAFDTSTGRERWRTPRPEPTSWASPIIVHHGGRRQVIVSGTERVRAYDLSTGKEIWQCGGLSANVVATPVAADGRVYVASSYDTRAMLAIDLDDAHGDITGSENVLWTRTERTPYVPSPLLYGDALYFLRHYQGVLTRVEAATGREPAAPLRLPGIRNIYASPVGAAERIYITDRQGSTIVLGHAETPEILAINRLPDRFSASPVPVADTLLLRGEQKLWCLGEPQGDATSQTAPKLP